MTKSTQTPTEQRIVVVRPAPTDWIRFDAALARDGSVHPVAKALYAALASFANQGGYAAPTRKCLGECIGRSETIVDRYTKVLEDIGLLEVERRKDPRNPKAHLANLYRLLDTQRWDERGAARLAGEAR